MTLFQTVMFFNYLFIELKLNCANTEKAKAISKVTGFNNEKIRQNLSNLSKKAYSNFAAFEKDMSLVSTLFEKLGLSEIVKKIEKEVERLERETEKDL